MLTKKQNYMMLMNGEIPEYIPKYDMMGWLVNPSMFQRTTTPEGYTKDEYGIIYTTTEESMGAGMPVPGIVLLDDITKWRDIVKIPDISHIDWEKLAKKDLANRDPENNPVVISYGDIFIMLVNMMSFTEALCAMHEEPEEVYELFDTLTKYFLEVEKNMLKHYNPDCYCILDDTAAAKFPFISVDMYQRLVKPFHKAVADLALNHGLKISMHCCGKCESFIDDWIDIGVSAWEPAQTANDLIGIKQKYGRKLAIMGGWDNLNHASQPEASEDELVEELKKYVDTFAPDGGFAFNASVQGDRTSEDFKKRMEVVNRVYEEYAKPWYKNH